jgi:DNA-binding beta-propeller fold protein YncE
VACDSEDNVYLADEHLHRISVFDGSGTFLGKWGEQGAGEGRLNGPAGLCFDPDDNLYVADHLNNRVQVFSREGVFQRAWGGPGDGPGQLDLPWGVAVDTERNVFVADWGNDRVQKFSPDGRFLASFGSSGQGDGQFHRPSCVAVDAEGVLYVSDWGNERVQVLASDGGFIEKLRGQATPSKWADEFFEANPDEAAARARSNITPPLDPEVATAYEESARIEPYFWGPVSVKLDSQGRLYVTETNRHRIQVYDTV